MTRWEFTRGIVKGTFSSHNFSLKWTFGEMVFAGPNSGARWGLSQVVDSFQGISGLFPSARKATTSSGDRIRVLHGSAAHLKGVAGESVHLVCMDPPYYDNVMYAELSDYFYVWQKRTLGDLYPEVFSRRLTNKSDEAVANIAIEGSREEAHKAYERRMNEIFSECRRVLKDDGLMTIMFTHKTQNAWETLTRSLIESGWTITSSFPVDSESEHSIHQKDLAAAASSIFITCRKRQAHEGPPAMWSGFGNTGVAARIREAVKIGLKEFEPLKLNPVDEMVASYGRALQVLSEQWPVYDGDEPVGPMKAMNEASRVVAETQISRLTQGRLTTADLDSESAMATIMLGIWGHHEFAFDDALSLSKSLNISLETKTAGYTVQRGTLCLNPDDPKGAFHAPVVKKGSKLRLARPEERHQNRLDQPQTAWDILHGLLLAYRAGDIPVAKAYLNKHASHDSRRILDLVRVWSGEAETPELKREADALLFGLAK